MLSNPIASAQMLIRRPVEEVFEAFVDPEITRQFWFSRGSGRLEPGRTVRWDWEMYGAHAMVRVREVTPNERILIEWDDPPCPVEWRFTATVDGSTMVRISNWGFAGTEDHIISQAMDSVGGFTIVLAGLKAYLEHGIRLNLVLDRDPEARSRPGDDPA